jgi:protein-tyrosine sulfotransferase
MSDADAGPIVLLGITPRSGTNYLWDLLLLHEDCAPAREPVREDLFLQHADPLFGFVGDVRSSWDPAWGEFEPDVDRRLLAAIGDGLLSFLAVDPARRLLTKSPSAHNIGRVFDLFPRARVLVLVRDGRSVVQSCMATFGWEFERAAREWSSAGSEIVRFLDAGPDGAVLLVRYEDLLDDLERSLRDVMHFLGLDPDRFDLEAAARLPVRGSSSYFGPGRDAIHWDPVERPPDFDPRVRWRSWSPAMLERFAYLAAAPMRRFGYDLEIEPRTAAGLAAHRLRDAGWWTRRTARRLAFVSRVRVGTATRPLRERLGLIRTAR